MGKVWDMRTRELKGELKDHLQPVVALRIFDDDRHVASASKDRTVVTWDIVNMKRLTCHEAHSGPLTSMLLCRNQCNMYTAGADHALSSGIYDSVSPFERSLTRKSLAVNPTARNFAGALMSDYSQQAVPTKLCGFGMREPRASLRRAWGTQAR